MNCLEIIGNLTVDPVMREVNINNVPTKVTNFSVAVNERAPAGVKKDPVYFRVHAWRGLAETCFKYLKKGRKVLVKGPVRMNSYKDTNGAIRYALEVRADDLEFLDANPDKSADGASDELETLDPSELAFTSD